MFGVESRGTKTRIPLENGGPIGNSPLLLPDSDRIRYKIVEIIIIDGWWWGGGETTLAGIRSVGAKPGHHTPSTRRTYHYDPSGCAIVRYVTIPNASAAHSLSHHIGHHEPTDTRSHDVDERHFFLDLIVPEGCYKFESDPWMIVSLV